MEKHESAEAQSEARTAVNEAASVSGAVNVALCSLDLPVPTKPADTQTTTETQRLMSTDAPSTSVSAGDGIADAERRRAEQLGASVSASPPAAGLATEDTIERVRGLLRALAVAREELENSGQDTSEGEDGLFALALPGRLPCFLAW